MTALDFVQSLLALAVCGALFAAGVARWPEEERRIAKYCWYAHAASAFATVAVFKYYYGYGDMLGYFRVGGQICQYLEYDLFNHFPKVLRLLLQQPTDLPVAYVGGGSSTGTVLAIAALLGLVTRSVWAGSVIVASLAAGGQALLWLGVRDLVPAHSKKHALICMFLIPSVVFWSSSMFKEAFTLMGMGVTLYGLSRVQRGDMVRGGVATVLGPLIIGLTKSYVLFPLAIACGVYIYWARSASKGGVRLRPVHLVAGAAITVGMLSVLGALFPAYAVDSVAESISQQQQASMLSDGGSNFRGDDADAPVEQNASIGLLKDIPFTVMTALVRPFFFEARSAMMLVNSVETTVIVYLLVMAIVRQGRVRLMQWMWATPSVMASVAFVLVFSAAVGLATTNLGALSRYRLPMMPFYMYVVLAAYALPFKRRGETRTDEGTNPAAPVLVPNELQGPR